MTAKPQAPSVVLPGPVRYQLAECHIHGPAWVVAGGIGKPCRACRKLPPIEGPCHPLVAAERRRISKMAWARLHHTLSFLDDVIELCRECGDQETIEFLQELQRQG